MKAKTIKKILLDKVSEWADSITDQDVANSVRENTIVTGGSIASMLLKEAVNDYDVYFKNIETVVAVAEYYLSAHLGERATVVVGTESSLFKTAVMAGKPFICVEKDRVKILVSTIKKSGDEGEVEVTTRAYSSNLAAKETQEGDGPEDKTYSVLFVSQNSITLTDKVQIVLRFHGLPCEIHENYDFTHCTCWWSSWDGHLELQAKAMECLLSRELVYQGSKYPLCSIIRTRKFIKRGWNIHAGQYLKMCMQLNSLDLSDQETLEDQLVGVDVAYFSEIVNITKASSSEITATYICELVDRIF